jgi:Plasma-membrane choline transporter
MVEQALDKDCGADLWLASTTQDHSTSMIYSEDDDSLSDAYFFPQSDDESANQELAKRTALWGTVLAGPAMPSGIPVEDTSLLPRPCPPRMIPRDVLWGFLFVLHGLVLLFCAIRFGRLLLFHSEKHFTIKTTTVADNTVGPMIIVPEPPVVDMIFLLGKSFRKVTALSTGFAMITSYMVFGFLVVLDIAMIYIMLGLSNLFGLACVMLGLSLEPYGGAAIAGLALFSITMSYTVHKWSRVDFATVHLHTAVSALRPDMGFVSFAAMLLFFEALLLWEWAGIGIVDSMHLVRCAKTEITSCSLHMESWHTPIFLSMIFSLMWITFVVLNTVRVIVAGLTASWWFAPNYVPAGGCFTAIAGRSVARALFISFGSICLGSLVVGKPTMWIDRLFSVCCRIGPRTNAKNGTILPASRSESIIILDMETYGVWTAVSRLCRGIRWYCSSWNKYAFCFVGMCEFAPIKQTIFRHSPRNQYRWVRTNRVGFTCCQIVPQSAMAPTDKRVVAIVFPVLGHNSSRLVYRVVCSMDGTNGWNIHSSIGA